MLFINRYLGRFNDELEQIEIVNSIGKRKGEQHIARKDAIRFTMEKERHQFEGPGFGMYLHSSDLSNQAL